jgi:hypothetical protein
LVVVNYHDDLKEFQGPAQTCALAPFDRAEWFDTLAVECGLRPLHAVARHGTDWVILPLQPGPGRIATLANWYTFRWRPLISPGADAPRLLKAIGTALKSRAWRLLLTPLPDEDGTAQTLAAALRAAGWSVRLEPCDINHHLIVRDRDFAAYLADRPGVLRSTVRRKAAKVEVEIRQAFDPAAWHEYETIYAASWKPEEGSPAFLRRFAEAEGAAGRLRLGLARVEGKAVAAQFWTVEGGTAWIHKLAHLPVAAALSPGTVLTAALLEQVIDRDRVTQVDFGTGDDPYKRDWMEQVRPRLRLEALNPLDPRAWPHLARRLLRR